MSDIESGSRHRQFGLIAASAVSVVAVVVVVALVAHPWRTSAARGLAAHATGPATSLDNALASPATNSFAASGSDPAPSAAPASAPTITTTAPSTTTTPSHRESPTASRTVGDNQINFNVSVQASPTQVVVGQPVRVTVTIVNAGGLFDRPVTMFFQGTDPSDNVSDAQSPCTAGFGAVTCPITDVRPGSKWSFTFSFIPGPFPAVGHFDDAIYVAFDYTDSHGQTQQTPQYFAHVMLFEASPSPSSPPSGVSSGTASPSATPASAQPTS
jgi:hypothetical protein